MTYLNEFTDLNTFMIEVVHRCLDNQGPTVLGLVYTIIPTKTDLLTKIHACKVANKYKENYIQFQITILNGQETPSTAIPSIVAIQTRNI